MRATQILASAALLAGSFICLCSSVHAQGGDSQFISLPAGNAPTSTESEAVTAAVAVEPLTAGSSSIVAAKNSVALKVAGAGSDAVRPAAFEKRMNERPKLNEPKLNEPKLNDDDDDLLDNADQASAVLGAVMLCGGGPLPHALLETFFELGQAKHGSLVIIPSASIMADQDDLSWSTGPWQQFPWANIQVLHARSRDIVDNDREFIKPLRQATAVWITGGDQSRLAERYQGTSVERELKRVVRRGGVIGGTSAGSAIASRVMIAGGRQQAVISNGLDLLPGSIIDQHFSQRKRHDRLVSAVRQHPDRVGIGIDESTGLVVSQQQARVLGAGSVYVYPPIERDLDAMEPLKFESGSAFDLPEYVRPKK